MAASVIEAFPSSLHHLLAECQRLDLLIRVQVWRRRHAKESNENLSPFYIPEEEIDEILNGRIGQPIWATTPLPQEVLEEVQARLDNLTAVIDQQKAATTIHLRLDELASHFHLSDLDRDILLITLAPEIDPRYTRLYGYLQNNVTHKYPSINLILNLLIPNIAARLQAHQRFTPSAPLRRFGLVHLSNEQNDPHPHWLEQQITVDNRIVRYLLDGDEIDGRLSPYATVHDHAPPLQDLYLPEGVPHRLIELTQTVESAVLYLQGPHGVGKQTMATAVAALCEQKLLVINGKRLLDSSTTTQFLEAVHLAVREACLQNAALFWDGFDVLLADDKLAQHQALLSILSEKTGYTFLSGNTVWQPDQLSRTTPFIHINLPLPSYQERIQLWEQMLSEEGMDIPALATKFRFTAGQIYDAIQTARDLARWRNPAEPLLKTADLYTASRRHSNQKLSQLAQKIEPHYGWDDIVLPPDRMIQLRQICEQVHYRGQVLNEWGFQKRLAMGKGTNALFAGPPGTGKTMAADIIAHELGLDLYKIDLASVVSKYIGETEKNLSKIFNEAEASNAILFFDEADALFGKRTEVRDSHDRYANLEVSYLLQKMEAYEGVVIMATNLHKNMDEAFRRRMHFIVEFPFPQKEERLLIWEKIWPRALPVSDDLDLPLIAERVQMPGGNIRNIALSAAFLAAADGQQVNRPILIQAIEREYQKIGKLLTGQEFEGYEALSVNSNQ